MKDDAIGFVTITGVKVTPDRMEATVDFTCHGTDAERTVTADGLARNAGRFRSHVGKAIRTRSMLLLKFVHDPSIEEGDKIDRLLKEVRAKEGW